MLPEITWKNVRNLSFPVYKLNSSELRYYRGVTYYNDKIIDDRNIEGDTIGSRRLKIYEHLYPLTHSALGYIDMVEARYRHFIDNKGVAFTYIKTKSCKVLSFKIKEVYRKESCSIITVKGCSTAFAVRRPPPEGLNWVGVIFIDKFPWEIIEYTERKRVPYRRMI